MILWKERWPAAVDRFTVKDVCSHTGQAESLCSSPSPSGRLRLLHVFLGGLSRAGFCLELRLSSRAYKLYTVIVLAISFAFAVYCERSVVISTQALWLMSADTYCTQNSELPFLFIDIHWIIHSIHSPFHLPGSISVSCSQAWHGMDIQKLTQ